MGQVNILEVPSCCFSRITADGLAEKSQFEPVAMASCGFQITRVVPPLRLKVRMIEIIPGEFESIAGDRCAVLRRERVENQKCRCEDGQPTPHGPPRAD